jgi:hypothetical protein
MNLFFIIKNKISFYLIKYLLKISFQNISKILKFLLILIYFIKNILELS